MMKNHFTNALKGILIGLILSILFSFLKVVVVAGIGNGQLNTHLLYA